MGGIAVNMKFTPSCMQGENEEKMLEFVRTFMRLGGFQLQLNAVDREILSMLASIPKIIVTFWFVSVDFLRISQSFRLRCNRR